MIARARGRRAARAARRAGARVDDGRRVPGLERVRRDGARGAVGVRRLEQPADGGGRGARSAAQPAARDRRRHARRCSRSTRVVNLGYFHALPIVRDPDVDAARSTARRRSRRRPRRSSSAVPTQALLAIAMTISALSAMNGSMLTGARVPYAVATRRPRAAALARLSATRARPDRSRCSCRAGCRACSRSSGSVRSAHRRGRVRVVAVLRAQRRLGAAAARAASRIASGRSACRASRSCR